MSAEERAQQTIARLVEGDRLRKAAEKKGKKAPPKKAAPKARPKEAAPKQ